MKGQRIRFLVRAERGEPQGGLCEEFDIHRSTAWRWRRRLREAGRIEEVGEKSRRPNESPNEIPEDHKRKILELRQRYGWGAPKLQVLLGKEGVKVSVPTISRVLKRAGAIALEASQVPAVHRFERSEPNQLWQIDFKGMSDKVIARHGLTHPLSILDDCSRFSVGLLTLRTMDGRTTQQAIERTFNAYGVPEAMLMDHGTPWWSTSNGHGLTELTVALMKQGIRLYFSGIRHPQTQGKVERFHRTLEQAIRRQSEPVTNWQEWADRFRSEYNQVRPHQALGMATPAERYRPSSREFQREPAAWAYEPGTEVKRLNSKGCVAMGGQRLFVCEALAGEYVCLEELNDKILVRFRNTYVRELDLQTGRTRPLVLLE